MASQFAWRDFGKKTKDVYSDYFPGVGKDKNLQDSVKFKVSSKAQKGVEFNTTVVNKDKKDTEAEFSTKFDFEDLEGVKFGFKAKNKPAAEFSIKLTDKIIPVEGASLTFKDAASGNKEQTFSVTGSYQCNCANANVTASFPVTKKFIPFLDDPVDDSNPLEDQRIKLSTDFMVKPMSDEDYYVGADANLTVPGEGEDLFYSLVAAGGYQSDSCFAAGYVKNSVQAGKKEGDDNVSTTVLGAIASTQVDDLFVSGYASYTFGEEKYGGVSVSTAASLKRDENSSISSKVQIIPDTKISCGYNQKLNDNVSVSFGYSFLLSKESEGEKTKSSAFSFGLDLSH